MNKTVAIVVAVVVLVGAGGIAYSYYSKPASKNPVSDTSSSQQKNDTSDTKSEKEQIINAVIKAQAIFSSKDATKIRAYMLLVLSDPAQKQKIQGLSDKDLVNLASLTGTLGGSVTADQLMAESTKIVINGAKADVTYKTSGGTATYTVTKVNGVWY